MATKYVLPNTSNYSAPTSAYRSPLDYTSPNDVYSPPNSDYTAPSSKYSTPNSDYYTAPNSKYSAPNFDYSSPNSKYLASNSDYSAPNSQYSAPKGEYSAPNSKYSAPNSKYSAPNSKYSAPNSDYSAPNSQYSAPTGRSGSRRRRPLNRGYLAPEDSLEEYNAVESVKSERRIPPPLTVKSTFYAAPETQVVSYFEEDDQPSYGGGEGKSGSETGGVGGGDYLKMLMNVIPGIPGQDYPLYGEIPQTDFSCQGRVFGGFYADPASQCQVFHVCGRTGEKYSFLCPNGTLFNQNYLTCDFWYNSDCSEAERFYSVNERIKAEREQQSQGSYRGQKPPEQPLAVYGNQVSDQTVIKK